ncbi:hypothetical protein HYZ80_03350 [Candidatus Parcubacteria bacterium]|nr:hypothetical protein [Candidatus Parcubacteria bacterium]
MGRPKYKNTLKRGEVRYIVFKDGDSWYAVGLEFNIVEAGGTPEEALLLLFEAIAGYVEAARKTKARPIILNQTPDPEYERMWEHLNDLKPVFPIHTAGTHYISPDLTRELVPA